MDADTIDYILRSRPTVLDIVEGRGYNVDSYKHVSPEDILKIATASSDLLKIVATKTVDDVTKRCIVLYWVENPVRLKLAKAIMELFDLEGGGSCDATTDELIILIAEPFHDVFNSQAKLFWVNQKTAISFFHLKQVIHNPSRHSFVPPHRILSSDEVATVIQSLHLKSKSELLHIKYHEDIQTRVLGAVPGDVIEIQRPSETCGLYTVYRICSL